jgi:hypothetical protein
MLGISERTLNRAKAALRVKAKRAGFGRDGTWSWALPRDPEDVLLSPSSLPNRQSMDDNALNAAKSPLMTHRMPIETLASNDGNVCPSIGCQTPTLAMNGQSMEILKGYSDGSSKDCQLQEDIEEIDLVN